MPEDAMTVQEVLTNVEELDGQSVTVAGWLGDQCDSLDCRVFQSRDDATVLETAEAGSDEWVQAYDKSINLCVGRANKKSVSWLLEESHVAVTGILEKDKMKAFGFDNCDFAFESISRVEF
ncbi:MAG: hypothetical protein AAGA34_01370 [Pseudomonadota bacterium]